MNETRRGVRLLLAGALCALGLLAAAAPAGAVTSARIIELLNAQRAAHGIPADIVERPDWSQACAAHNNYMRENNVLTHTEDPSNAFYTPEGAFAGENSVLARGNPGPNWEQGNPFENAPIHLSQLLAPRLAEMGAADDGMHVCATTFPGYTRPPATPTIFTYPGHGADGFPTEERAMEGPFVPGDFVGLPGGSLTGPYLQAFLFGAAHPSADVRLAEATLTGPSGPVAIETVDSTHPQVGPYLPGPMAFVIPEQPLKRGAYRLDVIFDDGGTLVATKVNFGAAAPSAGVGADAESAANRLHFGKGRVRRGKLVFELTAGPGLVGERAKITIKRSRTREGRSRRTITLGHAQKIRTAAPDKGEKVTVEAVVNDPAASARATYVGK